MIKNFLKKRSKEGKNISAIVMIKGKKTDITPEIEELTTGNRWGLGIDIDKLIKLESAERQPLIINAMRDNGWDTKSPECQKIADRLRIATDLLLKRKNMLERIHAQPR